MKTMRSVCRGFTLVELLTVLVIISLLAALLMPALRKAANYTYTDGHAEPLPWTKARTDQFPDHVVPQPLQNPPK
jgi:prepilin-type N-terminal cleavage/methylation domain-containing protein/prepilin-type processing-associated H-X9-DG protein